MNPTTTFYFDDPGPLFKILAQQVRHHYERNTSLSLRDPKDDQDQLTQRVEMTATQAAVFLSDVAEQQVKGQQKVLASMQETAESVRNSGFDGVAIPPSMRMWRVFDYFLYEVEALYTVVHQGDRDNEEITRTWEAFYLKLTQLRYDSTFSLFNELNTFFSYLQLQALQLEVPFDASKLLDKFRQYLDNPNTLDTCLAYYSGSYNQNEPLWPGPVVKAYSSLRVKQGMGKYIIPIERPLKLFSTTVNLTDLQKAFDQQHALFIRKTERALRWIEVQLASYHDKPQDEMFNFSQRLIPCLQQGYRLLATFTRQTRPENWTLDYDKGVRQFIADFAKLTQGGETFDNIRCFGNVSSELSIFKQIRPVIVEDIRRNKVPPNQINLNYYLKATYAGVHQESTILSSIHVRKEAISLGDFDASIGFLEVFHQAHIMLDTCQLTLSGMVSLLVSLSAERASRPVLKPKYSEDPRSIDELVASINTSGKKSAPKAKPKPAKSVSVPKTAPKQAPAPAPQKKKAAAVRTAPVSDEMRNTIASLQAQCLTEVGPCQIRLRNALTALEQVVAFHQLGERPFAVKESLFAAHLFLEQWLSYRILKQDIELPQSHNLLRLVNTLPSKPQDYAICRELATAYFTLTYDGAEMPPIADLPKRLVAFIKQPCFSPLPKTAVAVSSNKTCAFPIPLSPVALPTTIGYFRVELERANRCQEHLLQGFQLLNEPLPYHTHLLALKQCAFWEAKMVEHLLLFLVGYDRGSQPINHSLVQLIEQCEIAPSLAAELKTLCQHSFSRMQWYARYPFSDQKLTPAQMFILQLELRRELGDFTLAGSATLLNPIPVPEASLHSLQATFAQLHATHQKLVAKLLEQINARLELCKK